jgi:hypothetical protein
LLEAVTVCRGPLVAFGAQDTVEVVLLTSAFTCAEHAGLRVGSDWNCACSTTVYYGLPTVVV